MLAFRILFFVVALALVVGMNVFLYRRLVRDVTESRLARRVGLGLLVVLGLGVPLGRLGLGFFTPTWLAGGLMAWWGVALYVLLALLGLEVVRLWALRRAPKIAAPQRSVTIAPELEPALEGRGGGPALATAAPEVSRAEPELIDDPSRRLFISRAVAAGAVVIGGGVSSLGVYRAYTPPEVSVIPVKLPGLPKALDGFSIVQLSDIHVGPVIQEKFLDQLVSVANAAKPDLVAITGDLADGSPARLGGFVARFQNLASRHGTYFVSGNHDYYSGWEAWATALGGLGFNVLRNRAVVIGEPGASFDLIGVDDWGSRWMGGGYDLDAATSGRDPERPSVLMAHQPLNLEAVAEKRIGLQLSGHTHGGQIFPGPFIARMIYGDHVEGLSRAGDTQVYTSRGCGFVGPPMRVGSPPEVVKIVLVA